MAFYVKVDGSKRLYYPLEDISQLDNEQLTAARQLQIPGLAQMEKTMIDGTAELVYTVGGMQPLGQYISNFRGSATEKDELLRVLQRLLKLIQDVEKYPLLAPANLVLDPEYIWVDPKGEIYGVYLPLMQDYQSLALAWKKLIQELLTQAGSDACLLFLTKQMRLAEQQSVFSAADLQRQIQAEAQGMGGQNSNWGGAQPQRAADPYPAQPVTPAVSEPQPAAMPQNQMNSPQNMSAPADYPPRSNIQMMQGPNQSGYSPAPTPAAPVPPMSKQPQNPGFAPAPPMPNQPKNSGFAPVPPMANQSKYPGAAPKGAPAPKAGGKWNVPVLIIGHVVIVVVVVLMLVAGVLKNDQGNLDILNVILLAAIVIGGLLLIWLKLGVAKQPAGGQPDKNPGPVAPKPGKTPKSGGKVPGMVTPKPGAPGMSGGGAPGMGGRPMNSPVPPMNQAPTPVNPPMPPMGQAPMPMNQPVQPVQPVQPMQQSVPPMTPPVYEEIGMPEAEGTMIMGGANQSAQGGGTVLFQQESGAFLSIKNGGDKRKIMNSPYRLGRNADWKISDPGVSGMHCQVEMQNGGYYLVDIGSKNGTLLNSKRLDVNQYYPLNHGDEIRIGNTVLVFEIF